ncbi:MAG TPA: RDD family protein [Pyrinomonadaceae bacterium]|nr:RDD family protein [Pyrinomonadaceae bacterium]
MDADNFVTVKPLAGIGRRLAAYAVDAVLLFVGVGLLLGGMLGFVLSQTAGFEWTRSGLRLWAYVFATASIPIWLYYALLESGARQATLGMRLLGLRVTGLDGGRIGFGRALLRTAVKLIPFEINHAVLFLPAPLFYETEPGFRYGFVAVNTLMIIYLASALLTRRRQSIHDLVAGTLVVRGG